MSTASLRLKKELKQLAKNPVDGFSVGLEDESNLFVWNIMIMPPTDTLYEGAFFSARMEFPKDYPNNPPKLRFLTPIFHPNIYTNGEVCISILHPPGDDEQSGELASERWSPIQNVESILISVISMLSAPNPDSPANVDAAVMWRKDPDAFRKKAKECAAKSVEYLS